MFGACALLTFSACSNDDPAIDNGGNGNNSGSGDVAYLAINITTPDNNGSRAAYNGGLGKDYEFGTGNENTVKTAHFYFYDDEFNYFSTTNNWVGDAAGEAPNIEKKGKATLMLSGLSSKNYPKYVVTVLNQKDAGSFRAPDKLSGWANLEDWDCTWTEKEGDKDVTRFVMTTSSYFATGRTADNGVYYATELTPDNFLQELPEKEDFDETKRVQIYVERLAARVNVNISDKLTKVAGVQYTDEDGNKYDLYKTDLTVGGGANDEAQTELYVWFGGWELSTTSKKSHPVKSLEGWDINTAFEGWKINDENNYKRSYWGKSTGYGLSGNELKAKLNTKFEDGWMGLAAPLGYNATKSANVYCNECTNEIGNIVTGDNGFADPTATTTVLVKAGVCGADGQPLDLVSFRGTTFLKKSFIEYVFNFLNMQFYTRENGPVVNGKQLYTYTQFKPYYTKTVDGGEVETAAVEFVLAGNGTGSINIVPSKDCPELWILGEKTQITDENNGAKYDVYENARVATENEIKAELKKAHEGNYKAIAYTDGAMYYPIVIKHLNTKTDDKDKVKREGQYGVVRNHAYNVNITAINTLGEGVFNPGTKDEAGEPLTPDVKEPRYYVESTINILSWKLVEQDEEL